MSHFPNHFKMTSVFSVSTSPQLRLLIARRMIEVLLVRKMTKMAISLGSQESLSHAFSSLSVHFRLWMQ